MPLAALGIVVGQLALPVLFDAQSDEAIDIARVYLFTVVLVLVGRADVNGLLLGAADYLLANVLRRRRSRRWSPPAHSTLWTPTS